MILNNVSFVSECKSSDLRLTFVKSANCTICKFVSHIFNFIEINIHNKYNQMYVCVSCKEYYATYTYTRLTHIINYKLSRKSKSDLTYKTIPGGK